MYPLDGKIYCAGLRGRQGELVASLELDEPSKSHFLPNFILPPPTATERKVLSIDGMIGLQVGKISAYWGSRPCLLDVRFLKFDPDAGVDASWINLLLERGRSSQCRLIPVIDLGTDFYRVAAVGAHSRKSKSGAAIRVTLGDLDNQELKQLIDTQLSNLSLSSDDCLIVLDIAEADLSAPNAFATFLSDWIHQLRDFGAWPRIIVQASNYPRKNPASLNGQKNVSRAEWAIWKLIIQLNPKIKDFGIFGDYGADHGRIEFGTDIRRAYPHLRYATETAWLVARGGSKWETIRYAAQRIAKSKYYSGDLYSAGDELIAAWARGLSTIGTPTTWRTANMNRHLTITIDSLGTLYGMPVSRPLQRRRPVQEKLPILPAGKLPPAK